MSKTLERQASEIITEHIAWYRVSVLDAEKALTAISICPGAECWKHFHGVDT